MVLRRSDELSLPMKSLADQRIHCDVAISAPGVGHPLNQSTNCNSNEKQEAEMICCGVWTTLDVSGSESREPQMKEAR